MDKLTGIAWNVRHSSGVASIGALEHSTSNNFIFSSLWSKSESQLSNYCVVCEISWRRCQQLTALSISTALVTKLLVIEQLLHPAPKSIVSAPWHNFNLCPSSRQILATPLRHSVYTWNVKHDRSSKGKGKCGFIERLVVITPLRRSGMARILKQLSFVKQ